MNIPRRSALAVAALLPAGLLAPAVRPRRAGAAAPAAGVPHGILGVADAGQVLLHGDGPGGCDEFGVREASVFTDPGQPGRLYMHYDGIAVDGWLACLAASDDGGRTWTKLGRVLPLGAAGSPDSGSASSPWVRLGPDGRWHMWYLGAVNVSGQYRVPTAPYVTLHATAPGPEGPWTKHYTPRPFSPTPGTWYASTASPGPVLSGAIAGNQWRQWFSGSAGLRTIGLARTSNPDGVWTVDAAPLLPPAEQVENAAIYLNGSAGGNYWWLMANHIAGVTGTDGHAYTDAIWGYWSTSSVGGFTSQRRHVVLHGTDTTWTRVVGMPSLALDPTNPAGLLLFYDGHDAGLTVHDHRDIGLARLPHPLLPPWL